MNKKIILIILLALIAGCSTVETNQKEIPEIENNSDINIENSNKNETIKEPIQKEETKTIKEEEIIEKEPEKKIAQIHKYPFEINGKTTNIQFYNTLEEIEKFDYKIEISKEEFFETESFDFVFNSKPSSNGEVIKISGRLYPLLRYVYKFPLVALEDIISSDDITCEDSTLKNKIMVFDSDHTSNEVLYNSENGCIQFKTTSQKMMGPLGDKFLLHIIN